MTNLGRVVLDVPRIVIVLGYHARRAFGAHDRDRTALLAEANRVVVRGWLVQREDGQEFSIRRAAANSEITITLKHWPYRRPTEAPGPVYMLLAGGHARNVAVLPGSPIVLRLGTERHSEPLPGQEVVAGVTQNVTSTDTKDIALAVYSECGSLIRALTDVRFKLLALVPAISALALVAIVSPSGPLANTAVAVRIAAAVIGFVVIATIRMYDVRNSELYDDLISRARSLEADLGVELGAFNRRRSSVWPVEHDRALRWLYWAVLAAWLAAAFVPLI